jgi:hypothetical protein
MSTLFSLAIVLFSVVMVAVMLDAVISVSRKPSWMLNQGDAMQLAVIEGVDRREGRLPFVGADRRKSAVAETAVRKAA